MHTHTLPLPPLSLTSLSLRDIEYRKERERRGRDRTVLTKDNEKEIKKWEKAGKMNRSQVHAVSKQNEDTFNK